MFHCKKKNKGKDIHKRQGAPRVELCFAVLNEKNQRGIWDIIRRFEAILDDMNLFYIWAKQQQKDDPSFLTKNTNKELLFF